MKKFLLIASIAIFGAMTVGLSAQIELRNPTQENKTILKNPTQNNEFNTNAMPFDEKTTDGPRMNLNKFGVEQHRNLNIKQGNYNHYNQKTTNHNPIVGNIDRTVVNRPQSATLHNNQFNYNQNSNRKVESASTTTITYNTPMQVKPLRQKDDIATTDELIIETGDKQRISINPGDGSTTDPIAPGGNPDTPISDAIPFLVLLAGIYAFIIRRKQ